MTDHMHDVAQAVGMRDALVKAEGAFECIRLTLVGHLDEPERTAFWKAVEARNAVRAALTAQPPAAPVDLTDPVVVHVNMLRGTIAKPTWEQIKHLYPEHFQSSAASDPVGWRWRIKGDNRWTLLDHYPEGAMNDRSECEPLYRAVPQPLSVWHPIETAPKDGTPIEACNTRHPSHAPVIVRWDDDGLSDDVPEPHWCDAATRDGEALYYNQNYFDFWKPTTALPRPEQS